MVPKRWFKSYFNRWEATSPVFTVSFALLMVPRIPRPEPPRRACVEVLGQSCQGTHLIDARYTYFLVRVPDTRNDGTDPSCAHHAGRLHD